MNSFNILSSRVSPSSTPPSSRSNSLSHVGIAISSEDDNDTADGGSNEDKPLTTSQPDEYPTSSYPNHRDYTNTADEKNPLLGKNECKDGNVRSRTWHVLPSRLANNLINGLRLILHTIASPGVYLIACFYDERGGFVPWRQLRRLFGFEVDPKKLAADHHQDTLLDEKVNATGGHRQTAHGNHGSTTKRPAASSQSSSSGLSESESDVTSMSETGSKSASGRHSRSKLSQPGEEIAPARRSIRIKLQSDDALRQRKHRKALSVAGKGDGEDASGDISAALKSPTSPVGALTRYPRTPAPPRPLIPRRQPSFIPSEPQDPKQLKTLILDLDETLIHSLSKGGRMGSGHMVEVRLNTTFVGPGGQQNFGPQHPILYYVHKRPHCDEFLRKVDDFAGQPTLVIQRC
jgi:CTD nuclear envelope phosphatase 1